MSDAREQIAEIMCGQCFENVHNGGFCKGRHSAVCPEIDKILALEGKSVACPECKGKKEKCCEDCNEQSLDCLNCCHIEPCKTCKETGKVKPTIKEFLEG